MPAPDTVLLINRNGMGEADPELKTKLIQTYFRLIDEADTLPAVICFYAGGVHLVVSGSPVLESLRSLEAKGVHLIICNTCLKYYNLTDQVAIGIQGGMTDIIEAQRRAAKVITLWPRPGPKVQVGSRAPEPGEVRVAARPTGMKRPFILRWGSRPHLS